MNLKLKNVSIVIDGKMIVIIKNITITVSKASFYKYYIIFRKQTLIFLHFQLRNLEAQKVE